MIEREPAVVGAPPAPRGEQAAVGPGSAIRSDLGGVTAAVIGGVLTEAAVFGALGLVYSTRVVLTSLGARPFTDPKMLVGVALGAGATIGIAYGAAERLVARGRPGRALALGFILPAGICIAANYLALFIALAPRGLVPATVAAVQGAAGLVLLPAFALAAGLLALWFVATYGPLALARARAADRPTQSLAMALGVTALAISVMPAALATGGERPRLTGVLLFFGLARAALFPAALALGEWAVRLAGRARLAGVAVAGREARGDARALAASVLAALRAPDLPGQMRARLARAAPIVAPVVVAGAWVVIAATAAHLLMTLFGRWYVDRLLTTLVPGAQQPWHTAVGLVGTIGAVVLALRCRRALSAASAGGGLDTPRAAAVAGGIALAAGLLGMASWIELDRVLALAILLAGGAVVCGRTLPAPAAAGLLGAALAATPGAEWWLALAPRELARALDPVRLAAWQLGIAKGTAVGLAILIGLCGLRGGRWAAGRLVVVAAASAGAATAAFVPVLAAHAWEYYWPFSGIWAGALAAAFLAALVAGALAALCVRRGGRLGLAGTIVALALAWSSALAALDLRAGDDLPATPDTRWLGRRAEAGDVAAMIDYADRLQAGIGVVRSPLDAQRWLRRAAATGDPRAMYRWARHLERADAWTLPDPEAARDLMRRAAQAGAPDARARLRATGEAGDGREAGGNR